MQATFQKCASNTDIDSLLTLSLFKFLLSSLVISFCKTLVTQELRINSFQVHVTLLLDFFDTVAVSLEGLVACRVFLLFNHFVSLYSVSEDPSYFQVC